LGDAAQPAAEQRAKPRIEKKAKGRAHSAKGAAENKDGPEGARR
jgi:hypothetical protein